jgi:hypothetical protein
MRSRRPYGETKATAPDPVADATQVISALALLAGVVTAVITILSGRRLARREMVYRYSERIGTAEFSALARAARQFYTLRLEETLPSARKRWDYLDTRAQDDMYRLFNFWEEVSNVYLAGLFDEAIFKESIAFQIIEEFDQAHWLIKYLRTDDHGGVDESLYSGWQELRHRLVREGVPYTVRTDSDPDPPHAALPVIDQSWSPMPPQEVQWEMDRRRRLYAAPPPEGRDHGAPHGDR